MAGPHGRVEQPKSDDEIYAYFSSPQGIDSDPDAEEKARRRQALYKILPGYARAYANVAEDPEGSGYSTNLRIRRISREVERAIGDEGRCSTSQRRCRGPEIFEPAMRHLIDTYIRADDSRRSFRISTTSASSTWSEARGLRRRTDLPPHRIASADNVAEAIENNVRKLIIEETPVNPKFYEKMSELLSDLVRQRREDAIEYAEYLEKFAALIRDAKAGHGPEYPKAIGTPGKKGLYDNLDGDEALTLKVDDAVRRTAPHGWRGSPMKERKVRRCLEQVLDDPEAVERIFEILKNQSEY